MFDLFDFFLRGSRQVAPFELFIMGHVENEAVGFVENDTAFFQVQVKDVSAFFPVCRNEVGMPARRIDAAQIVRDVDADEAAVDIFKSEAAFIFFQDLGKGQIGLLLFPARSGPIRCGNGRRCGRCRHH